MKIIVVDDEPLVKQYIVQCVRDAGGENEITAAVTSGAKVLQEMKQTLPMWYLQISPCPKWTVLNCCRSFGSSIRARRSLC